MNEWICEPDLVLKNIKHYIHYTQTIHLNKNNAKKKVKRERDIQNVN